MTLYVMRHAPTAQNAETAGPERIRGWGNVGLGPEGKAVAQASAQAFAGRPLHVIFTSDLPRAKDTAEEVGTITGAPVVPTEELRTWNVGSLAGKLVDEAKPDLDRLQHVNPRASAPNGESYHDFTDRWGNTLEQLRDLGRQQDVLAVVHGRQVYALPHLTQGRGLQDVPTDGPPNPGDIVRVDEPSGTVTAVHVAQTTGGKAS